MTTYIIDQSIWSRVERAPAVADLVRQVARDHVIATCAPQALEYCHNAQTPAEYRERRADMDTHFQLPRQPRSVEVMDLQQVLWDNGLMRAAGTVDLLIAAYAIANDATVLSADGDFAAIAQASSGRLRHQFVEVT